MSPLDQKVFLSEKSPRSEELRQETELNTASEPRAGSGPVAALAAEGEELGAVPGTAAGEEAQGAVSEKGSHATRPNFNHSITCGVKITPRTCHLPSRAP